MATTTTVSSNSLIQLTALYFTGLVAIMGMAVFCWCGMWKIYLDVPLLLVLSNITVGAVSSFTTLLVGRTISQLNSSDKEQTPPEQPKP